MGEHNDDTSISFEGRSHIVYALGARRIRIDCEPLIRGIVLYSSSISHWDPPFEDEPIDEATRRTIVDGVERCCRDRGLAVEID